MIIYYDHENQFNLTEEEFKVAIQSFNSGKNVWVERLKVHLTPFYKWAGEKPQSLVYGRLHDGTPVIKRFGEWKDARSPGLNLDPHYYPEIIKDEVMTEESFRNSYKKNKRN